ncbi:MAG: hypothetical protein M3217_08705, partial [Actinomycetota bacterium]|nr:hypothetical protein [Actinomycetota bacterium]
MDVEPVVGAGRLPVHQHAKRHGAFLRTRAHDEIDVAGVEPEHHPPLATVQDAKLAFDRPIAAESPLVALEVVGHGVG